MLSYLPSLPTFLGGVYTGYKLKSPDHGFLKSTAGNIAFGVGVDIAAHALGLTTCKTAFKIGLFATNMICNGFLAKWEKENHIMVTNKVTKLPFDDYDGIFLASGVALIGSLVLGQCGGDSLASTAANTTTTYSLGSFMSYGLSYIIT